MRHQNANDSAFPFSVAGESGNWDHGMTVREWYAGHALTGLVQFADAPAKLRPAEMAEAAFRIADAMLAEAAKEKS